MVAVGSVNDPITDLESLNYNCYITLVSITILCYDFLLTFPSEVERFWIIGRLNCASFLFYLNRYLVLFGYIPILIENFWRSFDPDKLRVCRSLQTYHRYFTIVIQVVVASMSIMRIYALYKRNIQVLVFFVVVSVIFLTVGCWAVFGGKSDSNRDVLVYVGCGVAISYYRAIRTAGSWAAVFAFELLVFGMTLHRILAFPRTTHSNLSTIFLRDGAMYFGVLTVATLVNILIFLLSPPLTREAGLSFMNVISSVMMTRLMLNLRDPCLTTVPTRTAEDLTNPNLTFVESHYPTVLSDRNGFADENGRRRHSYEGSEAVDYHPPTSTVIELHRISV